jgi:hypothetical protein
VTSITYEAIAKFKVEGFGKYTFSGLNGMILDRINTPSNQPKIPEWETKVDFSINQMIKEFLELQERVDRVEKNVAVKVDANESQSVISFGIVKQFQKRP